MVHMCRLLPTLGANPPAKHIQINMLLVWENISKVETCQNQLNTIAICLKTATESSKVFDGIYRTKMHQSM